MLNANVINDIAIAGIMNKYKCESITSYPDDTIFPSDACGIGTPNPI